MRCIISNTHTTDGPGYHWFTVAYSIRRRDVTASPQLELEQELACEAALEDEMPMFDDEAMEDEMLG